jgi:hypothetical protein
MFQKIAFLLTAAVTLISLNSFAQYMGIEAGIRQQDASPTASGASTNTNMALQFGLIGAFTIKDPILFRTGFLYTQRPVSLKGTGGAPDTKFNFNYVDIPLTVMWKMNEFGGVYGGVNLALVASATCDNCAATANVDKKGAMPLVIGGTFKFAPMFGVDVYYEAISTVNDTFKDGRAVGANLLITFD